MRQGRREQERIKRGRIELGRMKTKKDGSCAAWPGLFGPAARASIFYYYSLTAPPMTPATNCFWNTMKMIRIGRVAMAVANKITAQSLLVGLPSRTINGHMKLFHILVNM